MFIRSHRSFALQRSASLRSICSLTPFTGSLTHFAHSLMRQLKFLNMCSCCKLVQWEKYAFLVVSRNTPRVTQRVVSLPQLFALLLRSIRIGVAFASKNKAKGQPARHKTDRKRDIGFETDKWLDRQTETQLEALKRLCWYCVKVVIRHSDVETDRQSN